jgi:predicted porin
MKKTLLAAALLAGFASAAQAQSSVTLYGLVDVGYVYTKSDGRKSMNELASGNQSGSRWGLQGAEDLGGGLKATFLLESGFDESTGQSLQGSRLFGRQSWAGLSGGFGDIRFGRQVTVTSEFFGAVDPFGAGFNAANLGNTFVAMDTVRTDNTIKYISPNFGGFQAAINYSANNDGQEQGGLSNAPTTNNRLAGAALRFSNGPLLVAASFDTVNYAGTADTAKVYQVGGVYDFGVVKLHAAFANQKDIGTSFLTSGVPAGIAGAAFDDTKAYMLGVTVPLGNGSLFGSYKRASDWDVKGWQVGYTYDLSKRTNVYTYFAAVDNLNFTTASGGTGVSRGGVANDNDTKQFGVGLRHKF